MNRRLRLALGGAAVAAALTATAFSPAIGDALATPAATASSATASSATASAWREPHRCYKGELSVGLHPQQPRDGQYGFILTLTNTSARPCSIYGYPGLGLENGRHKVLRYHTKWASTLPFDRDPGPHLLVLSPGETASGDVAWVQAPTHSSGVRAVYLMVTPPNDYSHFTVRIPGGAHWIYLGILRATAMARHTPF